MTKSKAYQRESEIEFVEDRLGTQATRSVARAVADAVRDPKCHPSMYSKAARALVDRDISGQELTELLDAIVAKREAGTLHSPGAYFVSSLKRMFAAAGRRW